MTGSTRTTVRKFKIQNKPADFILWFFVLISKLPFWFLFRISDGLFLLLFHLVRYRRRVVRENLEACFPEKSASDLYQLEQQFYRHLSDVVVETIKLISISPNELKQRIRHENPELTEQIISEGKSFVAMATHMANWEWLLAGNALYLNGKIDAVYKPLHNRFFEKLMLRIRTRFGCHPVPSDTVLRSQIYRRSIPKGIAMAADQTPGSEGSVIIPLLGRPTYFFKGPPKLASKLDFPMVYAGIRKEARGRYVLFVEPLATEDSLDETSVLKEFSLRLERDIRRQPALWLWSHRRWKHSIPEEFQKKRDDFSEI